MLTTFPMTILCIYIFSFCTYCIRLSRIVSGNKVIYDGDNPSHHNLLFLAVTSLSKMSYVRIYLSFQTNRVLCSWNKAHTDLELYTNCIYAKLDSI